MTLLCSIQFETPGFVPCALHVIDLTFDNHIFKVARSDKVSNAFHPCIALRQLVSYSESIPTQWDLHVNGGVAILRVLLCPSIYALKRSAPLHHYIVF